MKIKSISLVLVISSGFALSACGDRTKFDVAKNWIPALSPGHGRLLVYHPRELMTTLSTFTFVLNGEEIADFNSGTGFYLDLKAGQYEISYNRLRRKLKIAIPAGESVYVKYTVVLEEVEGRNFRVDQVPTDQGANEMNHVFLIEPKIPYFRVPYFYF